MKVNMMDVNVKKATDAIISSMRMESLPNMNTFDFYAAVCLLKAASKSKIIIERFEDVAKLLDTDVLNLINKYSKVDAAWRSIKEIAYGFDTEVFDEILLRRSPNFRERYEEEDVPDCLSELIFRLLKIKEGDRITNVCARNGMLLVKASMKFPAVELTALEASDFSGKTIALRNLALDNKVSVDIKKDFGSLITATKKMKKANKIISTHPLGMRSRVLSKWFSAVQEELPFVRPGTAADWIFCSSMMNMLEDGGKAIALTSLGCLFTDLDKGAREHFIKYGFINTIIKLPGKLFSSTSIPLALIVLSRGNEKVRFVDASDIYTAGRRQNELSEKDLQTILESCDKDNEHSIVIDNTQLAENDYYLMPERYRASLTEIQNGQELKELVSFKRGMIIKASDLDTITADESTPSNAFYLRLSDITNGVINDTLPKLKQIDPEFVDYQLEDKDIILSRNGSPFKIAIFNGKPGEKVYPVGNLYVLRANSKKIDPYYLKAYLESEQGIGLLKGILTGVTIQVISLEKLKAMQIPVPSMEEQQQISERYLAILDELEILRLKTIAAKEKLVHVLDNAKAGE